MPTQSLPDVLARLSERGFTDHCRADDEGIRFLRSQAVYPANTLTVDEIVRLEGTSAPDEQVAVYALVSPDGNQRGSYTVPHGIDVEPRDADAILAFNMSFKARKSKDRNQPLRQQY